MQQLRPTVQEMKTTPLPIQTAEATPADVTPAELELEAPAHIIRLIKRLRRRSPVRKIAERLLEQPQPLETIAPLLHALSNPSDSRWKERTVAAWALGQFAFTVEQNEEVVPTLGRVLESREKRGRRTFGRFLRLAGRSSLCAVPLTIVGIYTLFAYAHSHNIGIGGFVPFVRYNAVPWELYRALALLWLFLYANLFFSLYISPLVLPFSIALDASHSNRVRAETAITLGRLRDPQSISSLAAAMRSASPRVRQSAGTALRQLLPLLTSEHYGQLSAQTVPNLCRLLAHQDKDLILLLLDALDKIGNESALPSVERLSSYGPSGHIRRRAEHTLAFLKERRRQEQNEQNLLRASQASSPETLLRAANMVAETDPQELLRISQIEPCGEMEA